MNKNQKDQLVHKKLCYFSKYGNTWIPYDLTMLTLEHLRIMELNEKQEKRIKGLEATIEGKNRDIRYLEHKYACVGEVSHKFP